MLFRSAGDDVPIHISDCHVSQEVFLRRHDMWKLMPFQVHGEGSPLHGLCVHDGMSMGRILAVKDILTVREVLRRRWGPLLIEIVRPLLDRGVPVVLGWAGLPRLTSIPVTYVPTIFRPEGYVFKYHDYLSYVRRRISLFKDLAVAEPAVREGGILWRLALESEIDLDKCCMVDQGSTAYQVTTIKLRESEWSVRVLPEAIGDSLIGMYKIYTGLFPDINC